MGHPLNCQRQSSKYTNPSTSFSISQTRTYPVRITVHGKYPLVPIQPPSNSHTDRIERIPGTHVEPGSSLGKTDRLSRVLGLRTRTVLCSVRHVQFTQQYHVGIQVYYSTLSPNHGFSTVPRYPSYSTLLHHRQEPPLHPSPIFLGRRILFGSSIIKVLFASRVQSV